MESIDDGWERGAHINMAECTWIVDWRGLFIPAAVIPAERVVPCPLLGLVLGRFLGWKNMALLMHSSSSGPCYSYSFCRNNNNKPGNEVRVVVVNGETISSLLLVLHSSTDMNQSWSPLHLKDLPPKKENIFNTRMKIFTVPIKLYFLLQGHSREP